MKSPETDPSSALFYNTWGGRYQGAINRFIAHHKPWLDVICLTEVTSTSGRQLPGHVHTSLREREPPMSTHSLQPLIEILPEFESAFDARGHEDMTCLKSNATFKNVRFGSAMFWHQGLHVVDFGSSIICANLPDRWPRVMQWIVYEKAGTRYLVAHLHGVWIADNTKGDHPVREQQSREVRSVLDYVSRRHNVEHIVFGGDLNLAIDTKALALLLDGPGSDIVYRDLVTAHHIRSTRTEEYRKFGQAGESLHADYVLVSPAVEVHDFQVMTHVRASDHAPLIVRFS